jgi:hypothetical protein
MTGVLRSKSSGKLIGYRAGAGATVVQATSKATAVVANTAAGRITTAADSLAGAAEVAFTVTNSLVEVGDVPVVAIGVGGFGQTGTYQANVTAVANGSFQITLANVGATALEAVTINFAIIKGAVS